MNKTAQVKFPWKVFSRIIMLQAYLALLAFGASGITARYFFRHHFEGQLNREMQSALMLFARNMPAATIATDCRAGAEGTPYRLTVISVGGETLCDSSPDGGSSAEDRTTLDRLAERLQHADGNEPRFISEEDRDHLHVATLLRDRGLILLGTVDRTFVERRMHVFDTGLFTVLVLAAAGLGFFAIMASRRLVVPLGELILKASSGDPEAFSKTSLNLNDSGEWVELETALDQIQSDLRQKTDTLSREREELATLMSAISDAIIAVDITGKPLFFNSRFALQFFDKDMREKQPHLGEIFRTPEVLNAFHLALREGQAQEVNLPLYVKTDPAPRYFSISISPLRREVGPVYGALGIFHDVTELKRAENIRIEFVANVSHELRTPLTAIKGYTDTLREDVARGRYDSAGKFLDIVSRNVDRLMGLISDLLDLSSLESADLGDKIQKSPVHTRELTERVLAQLDSRRAEKNHKIEAIFGVDAVDAEPSRIEQVLVNLVENSVKYVPAGGKIVVEWENKKGAVLLKVSDNGPGIPPEHHSRLFERFYRVDAGRDRASGGTGLGLAIVKHIMQRHGGSVWVTSEAGRGTQFVCQFPKA